MRKRKPDLVGITNPFTAKLNKAAKPERGAEEGDIMSLRGDASIINSSPPDANLYHWVHRILLECKPRGLQKLLLRIAFTLETFYVNKVRPVLGFHYSEKYLAYSWILGSSLLSPKKRILDIGCGDSLFPSRLAGLGYQCYAVDLLRTDCIAANDPLVHFAQSDVCYMPFQSGKFNVITAISTLEHVDLDKMELAVQEIKRVLQKGGTLFVTMPDCDWADNMKQLLVQNFKVINHEHRILTDKKIITNSPSTPVSGIQQQGVGVTFLLFTTL